MFLSSHNHPLLEPIERLRTQPCVASFRRFILISRTPGVWQQPATWGDVALGGSLGLLDLAADLALPSVLRRGLQAGLRPGWRTQVLAWRSRCPKCLALLATHSGAFPHRPWPDPQLQDQTLFALAQQQARALRTGLDAHISAPAVPDRL